MIKRKMTVSSSGLFKGIDPILGTLSMLLIIGFVAFTSLNVKEAAIIFSGLKGLILKNFNWYYVGLTSAFFFICGWLMVSKLGNVKLGADDEKPEFSTFSWLSMLFGAGMGIAMMFWSIAEPISHFQGNPFLAMEGIAPLTSDAARVALRLTFFHWGFHGWAIYAVAGLAMAYFSYRKGLPLTVRAALYPILGDRVNGPLGYVIDLLVIFASVFGVATSLGLGVAQLNAGLNFALGFKISTINQLILIGVISIIVVLATVSGVAKGIRIISEWNIVLTILFLLFFFIAGPTLYLLGTFVTSMGDYISNMVFVGTWVDTKPGSDWQGWWTVFYWGWYIAFTPFVGMFIARISRGRTVREFLFGVIILPCIASFIWIVLFGGTALHMELYGQGGIIAARNADLSLTLYKTIEALNVGAVMTFAVSILSFVMIVTWFVTTANAGTMVICSVLALGSEAPPDRFRIFWGAGIGAVAGALLLAGGLQALQAASIISALPFSIVMIMMVYSLIRSLTQDSSYRAAGVLQHEMIKSGCLTDKCVVEVTPQ